MKRLLFALPLLLLGAGSASAAELKILAPADRTVVKGIAEFKILPEHAKEELFLQNPEVILQNEYGEEVQKLPAARDPKTNICTTRTDTSLIPDGMYLVTIKYRVLVADVPKDVREDLTIGVVNKPVKPGRLYVNFAAKDYKVDQPAEVTVTLVDGKGKRIPAHRVTFKVDKGEVDTDAEITDSSGEAIASVYSDEAQVVTLTVSVDGIPAVTRTLKFVE